MIMFWVGSNWFRCVWCSSSGSTAVLVISLKIVAYFVVVADMMRFTWLVVGIMGAGSSYLKCCFW